MLVLTRKTGEAILIGTDITIKIIRIGTNQIRIAIEAPISMDIVRAELVQTTPHPGEAALNCGTLGNINPQYTSQAIREAIEQQRRKARPLED